MCVGGCGRAVLLACPACLWIRAVSSTQRPSEEALVAPLRAMEYFIARHGLLMCTVWNQSFLYTY